MGGKTTGKALLAALVLVIALGAPAQGNIDVTVDIAGTTGGPTNNEDGPRTPARTGFDPLPMGGLAALFIALGVLGLVQSKTERKAIAS